MLRGVLDLVLPQRCAVCERLGPPLCAACRAQLVPVGATGCARCGAPGPWPVARCVECTGRRLAFASARAAVVYDARARAFVRAWKEHGRRDLAAVAADLVAAALPCPDAAALAFVPGDRDRGLKRGHAPPERLARALGERWAVPVQRLLARRGGSARQRGLGLAERRRNVRGAFEPVGRSPPRVCLVDDIYTSGATAAAAASALRAAGARRVEVVTFARALR